jgi:TonB-dependent SusC/RagA subfamily outer membrane receptor
MNSATRITVLALALAISHSVAGAQVRSVVTALNGEIGVQPRPGSLLSKKVDLLLAGRTIPQALVLLSEASHVSIAFSPNFLPDRLVTCLCRGTMLSGALDTILDGTGFGYLELDGQVVISPQKRGSPLIPGRDDIRLASLGPRESVVRSPVASGPAAPTRQGTVTGMVLDQQTKRPLPDVAVSIAGTQLGSRTAANGRFLIANVPPGPITVRVQLIGYTTAEQAAVVEEGGTTIVNFELREQPIALDAILVTSMAGEARHREVGNTITRLNTSGMIDFHANVDQILQTQDPSVLVSTSSAQMGGGAQIRLRGNVSVSQSNQPLVYVDGVRQSSDAYPRNWTPGQIATRGNHSQASPLNDVNAADIERIEILKGASATTLYGTEAAAGVIQIFTKRGVPGRSTWELQVDQGLNWITAFGSNQRPYVGMEPWLGTGHVQQYSISVNGGGEDAQYFLSTQFRDGKGILDTDEEQRIGVRANIAFRPTETLRVDWTSFFNRHEYVNGPHGTGAEALFSNVMRAPYNPLGSGEKEDLDKILAVTYPATNERLNIGLMLRWSPLSRFTNRLQVGYDEAQAHNEQFKPYGFVFTPEGEVVDTRWQSGALTVDNVANFEIPVTDQLRSTFTFGGQLIKRSEHRIDGAGNGVPGPGRHTVSNTAVRRVSSASSRVNTGGFFFQNLLGFRERYFVTAGLRVDGNSAFGRDFGLQPYPKLSASWVVSEEPWAPEWGTLKLRAAYGHAGRAPGAFDAVRTWQSFSFDQQLAFYTQNLGNPDLGPERTVELEAGFDGAFFSDRVSVDFTWFTATTKDALFPVAQPPSLGFLSSQLENVGELTNRGIELSVNASLLDRRAFGWNVGVGIATLHSKVIDVGSSTSPQLQVGQPVPVVRGTKVLNADEFADPIEERNAFFGPNHPTHTITLHTDLRLPRNLVLTGRGEYLGGHWMREWPSHLSAREGSGAFACDDVYELVPWAEYRGPGNTHPNLDRVRALDRARCYRSATDDHWVHPADFFKLREVSLQVPLGDLIPGTSRSSLTVSGRNLWRWINSDFDTIDPEIVTDTDQITSLVRRVYSQIPPPAALTFSLRAIF